MEHFSLEELNPEGTTSIEALLDESSPDAPFQGTPAQILTVAESVLVTPEQIAEAVSKLSVVNATPPSTAPAQRSDPGQFRDVHSFDGHLERMEIPVYDEASKEALFSQLKSVIPTCVGILDQFIKRVDVVDNANSYQADDMLMYLLLHNKGEDLLHNLREQLEDITTLGPCPQGKVTRILSLIQAFC